MEFKFPKPIWLRFHTSKEEQGYDYPYMSRLLQNTRDVKECIADAKDKYGYVVVEGNDYYGGDIYEGVIDADAVIARVEEVYHDYLRPLAEVDAYVLSDEFMEKVVRYLEAAKILVSDNSDMEEIIYQRDKNYAEDEEIQKCIDVIRSIEKA